MELLGANFVCLCCWQWHCRIEGLQFGSAVLYELGN